MDLIFPVYAEEFLENLKESGRTSSTLIRYRSDLNKFFSWLQLSKQNHSLETLSQLSSKDYEGYVKALEKKKLSDATIKRLITVLNGLLRYLGIQPVQRLTESAKSRPLRHLKDTDFITEGEFNRLHKSMRSRDDYSIKSSRTFLIERNLAIVSLIRFYGLTPPEVFSIEMKDINLAQGTLIVDGPLSPREIKLDDELMKYLTTYLNLIDKLKRPRIRTHDPLFVAFNNTSTSFQFDYAISRPKRLSVRSIQEMIKDEVLRAGLRKISATHMRNTYILDLLIKGLSDTEVLSSSGLMDPFSLRRYKHYLSEKQK